MSEMTMRERIARAIQKQERRIVCQDGDAWDIALSDYQRAPYLAMADAVLDVLAEPDEGMIEAAYNAGLDIYWSYRSDGRQGGAEDVWTAMLQAARTPGAIEETGRRG